MSRKLIAQELDLASLAYAAGWKCVGRLYYDDALLVWIAYVGYEVLWAVGLTACLGSPRGVAPARASRGPHFRD